MPYRQGIKHPGITMARVIKQLKTMVVKTMTENDNHHDPVKITIEAGENNDPEAKHILKSQRKNAPNVVQVKDLYEKKVPGIMEETKRRTTEKELEGIYSTFKAY